MKQELWNWNKHLDVSIALWLSKRIGEDNLRIIAVIPLKYVYMKDNPVAILSEAIVITEQKEPI